MAELKLAKLPDRTPVKHMVTVSPELNADLHDYADIYEKTYGQADRVPELIPFILQRFLDGDRGFAKARKQRSEKFSESERKDTSKGPEA
ncbi:MAG: DUF2274 domain-containing protein [Rhodospirillaceae bacterium]|nr:DUF2274 domain-containing protein [Rhodospirillaceae bacterium]